MSFTEAIRAVLGQYANFNGRARRSEYWYFYLLLLAVAIVDYIGMFLSVQGSGIGMPLSVLAGFAALALLVPALAVTARRLHDIL